MRPPLYPQLLCFLEETASQISVSHAISTGMRKKTEDNAEKKTSTNMRFEMVLQQNKRHTIPSFYLLSCGKWGRDGTDFHIFLSLITTHCHHIFFKATLMDCSYLHHLLRFQILTIWKQLPGIQQLGIKVDKHHCFALSSQTFWQEENTNLHSFQGEWNQVIYMVMGKG